MTDADPSVEKQVPRRGFANRVRPIVSAPPVLTFTFLLATAAVFYALGVAEGDDPFTANRAWLTWKLAAAFGVASGALLGVLGIAEIVRFHRRTPAASVPLTWCSVAAALVLTLLVLRFLGDEAGGERDWPIDHMSTRLQFVARSVAISAVPWLALVWMAHASLRHSQSGLDAVNLRARWSLLVACVSAFAAYVVIALVPTGALRSAWLAQNPADTELAEEFPASDVLLYGAFFAVLLTAIAVPLIAVYRARSAELVERTYQIPPGGRVDESWAAGRSRLEAILHLDTGLLRNPLTALSFFTPLITSVLAAFLPELRQD